MAFVELMKMIVKGTMDTVSTAERKKSLPSFQPEARMLRCREGDGRSESLSKLEVVSPKLDGVRSR